jgi:hypothetical protein
MGIDQSKHLFGSKIYCLSLNLPPKGNLGSNFDRVNGIPFFEQKFRQKI